MHYFSAIFAFFWPLPVTLPLGPYSLAVAKFNNVVVKSSFTRRVKPLGLNVLREA